MINMTYAFYFSWRQLSLNWNPKIIVWKSFISKRWDIAIIIEMHGLGHISNQHICITWLWSSLYILHTLHPPETPPVYQFHLFKLYFLSLCFIKVSSNLTIRKLTTIDIFHVQFHKNRTSYLNICLVCKISEWEPHSLFHFELIHDFLFTGVAS